MEKFTKGPWHLDKFGNILPEGAIDGFSCIRAGGLSLTANKGEPMYNRHLIAAAPEMYEMLEDCMLHIFNECPIDEGKELIAKITDLRKKARGEK